MLQIGKALVSLDIFDKKFVCELGACKGICCVEGDSGAPLEDYEVELIDKAYPVVKKYMTPEGIKSVEQQGTWVIDNDDDLVTPLVNNVECAYTFTGENGLILCAIEKAFRNKEIDFYKPISCHLYPIRITKYEDYDAVNYESNDLCTAACVNGESLGVPLYKFVKGPLIRKYGEDWYKELKIAAVELEKYRNQQ